MTASLESRVLQEIRSRIAHGEYTAYGLALRAGFSVAGVNNVLNGNRRASTEYLSSLASAAGLEWSDLVAMSGGPMEPGLPVTMRQKTWMRKHRGLVR